MAKKQTVAVISLISNENGIVKISTQGTKAAPGAKIRTWMFNWNDGTIDDEPETLPAELEHEYKIPGEYSIKLQISDSKGRDDEMGMIVRVDQVGLPIPDPPPPDPPVPPPTDPPPGIGLVTYNFPTIGWTSQMAMAFPMGMIPNLNAIQIGAFPTQFTPKRTWPDGSVKHAIVKANILIAGNHDLIPIANPGGSFTPASWPTASVNFTIGANIYTATLGAIDLSDTWEDGALCRSARKKVVPMNGATPHPLLEVWFDVSSFLGGGHIVDISFNNVHDKASANQLTYNVEVIINGVSRYTGTSKNHKYFARGRVRRTVDLTEATYTPDFSLFYQAKALPEFSPLTSFQLLPSGPVSPDEANNNFTSAQYDIFNFGGMLSDMGNAGWRPEISTPYPDPLARWLVHKNQGSFSLVKKWADLSGSWSGHLLNEADNTFVTTTTHSHYWLDYQGRAGAWPLGPKGTVPFVGIQGCGAGLENAHLPQIIAPAYILTGDRYYADQLAFWAAAVPLMVWPGADTWYGHRVPDNIIISDQIRGLARGLMTVQDAAAYLPDGHQLITYLTNMVVNNLNFLDADCAFRSGGPFSAPSYWIIKNNPGAFHPDWQHTIPWTDGFVLLMAWKARRHQLTTTQGNTYMNRISQMWKNLFDTPGWPLEAAFAAPYAPFLIPAAPGPTNFDDPYNTTSRQYSTDIPAMVSAMGGPGQTTPQFAGYYDVDARQGLMIAETRGIDTDAQLAYLLAQPNVLADLAYRSGHYIINVRDLP